ncbi:hypothetical protein ACWPKS_09530 [Coraliomargarita sp. W4R72]
MKSKVIIAWLLSLFAWNAVFGAFGGILLCLHEDLSLHLETSFEAKVDCAPNSSVTSVDFACVSRLQYCVDIELTGDELPTARLTPADSFPTSPVYLVATLPDFYWNESSSRLSQIENVVAPRAPPNTTNASVQVVQLIQLRV